MLRDGYLPYCLANFDKLRGAGFGVGFEFAAFRPVIGGFVMVDVAEEQARLRAMDD
jgi:hypothetical protein